MIRAGLIRGLAASLGSLVLLLPVGVETTAGVGRLSLLDGASLLASGHLGVGLLGGLVAGGAVLREASYRIVLAFLAVIVYMAAAMIRQPEQLPGDKRVTCPYCRSPMSKTMVYCPACGRTVRPAS